MLPWIFYSMKREYKRQFRSYLFKILPYIFFSSMQKCYLQRTIDNIFFNTPTRIIRYSMGSKFYQHASPQYIHHKKDKLSMSKVFDIRGKVSALEERYRSNKRPRSLATSYRISNGAIIDFAMPCSRRHAACTSNSSRRSNSSTQRRKSGGGRGAAARTRVLL